MKDAVEKGLTDELKLREAATSFLVSKSALKRIVSKYRTTYDKDD